MPDETTPVVTQPTKPAPGAPPPEPAAPAAPQSNAGSAIPTAPGGTSLTAGTLESPRIVDAAVDPRIHDLNEEAKRYRLQLRDAEKRLDELQKQTAPAADVQKQIGDLQQQLTKAQAEAQQREKTLTVQNAVLAAAAKAGLVDPADAIRLLDTDKFDLKDGAVTGLDTAIQDLIKAKPYLVKTVFPQGVGAAPTSPGQVQDMSWLRRAQGFGTGDTFGGGGVRNLEDK